MKHRSNHLLGCFCFPGKSSEKKLLPEIVKSGSHRRKTRWLQRFRWSSFLGKKSDGKTVPVDVNLLGKRNQIRENHSLKPANDHQKLASKFLSPAAGDKQAEIQAVQSDQKLPEQANDKKLKKPINIIVDDSAASEKIDTHKTGVFSCQKKIVKAKTVDDPDSPSLKKKSIITRCQSQPAFFQSVSHLPPHIPKKQAAVMGAEGGRNETRENSKGVARTYDSVIGMLIIVGILVVTLLWGKLCAILFTSAGLCFVSRFGAITESNLRMKNEGMKSFEVDSEVYDKKKVVMEGILARNHRRKVVGFL